MSVLMSSILLAIVRLMSDFDCSLQYLQSRSSSWSLRYPQVGAVPLVRLFQCFPFVMTFDPMSDEIRAIKRTNSNVMG
jgi:hypothetical protein